MKAIPKIDPKKTSLYLIVSTKLLLHRALVTVMDSTLGIVHQYLTNKTLLINNHRMIVQVKLEINAESLVLQK